MGANTNELEQFIYQICYQPMWEEAYNYIYSHPTTLDLSFSRIKYPDRAYLRDMLLEFTSNIEIDEDFLSFDAIVSATIELHADDDYYGSRTCDTSQWLVFSCRAEITDKLKTVTITNVKPYSRQRKTATDGIAASRNIVPIISKDDLEDEATRFLSRYCPEALEQPMPVPIEAIAEKLGLIIIQNHRITEDFSVIGEICFSSGEIPVWDLFKCVKQNLHVNRGTILVDACTYLEQNLGRVKNTLAHEVFHWHRHRLYAAIKQILRQEKVIACRCPVENVYPGEEESWTDEQRMEWQANNIAPRILMPLGQFKQKVDELYKQYDYVGTPLKLITMECIAQDLASFYEVSRQSVLIRMMECGYPEANSIYTYNSSARTRAYITDSELFLEYRSNEDFRNLIDSGAFKYVEGYVVVNDADFIYYEQGKAKLTDYAWEHLAECTLQFSLRQIHPELLNKLPFEIFHRVNGGADRDVPQYDNAQNKEVLQLSEELQDKRAEFEKQKAAFKLTAVNKSCWNLIYEIIQSRGMSKAHFCNVTNLGEEVYRKAEKNKGTPQLRTIVAISCGLDLDLSTTERLLTLAGHAFDESDENQALKFCITGLAGYTIEERNEFLASYGYEPLGTKERS